MNQIDTFKKAAQYLGPQANRHLMTLLACTESQLSKYRSGKMSLMFDRAEKLIFVARSEFNYPAFETLLLGGPAGGNCNEAEGFAIFRREPEPPETIHDVQGRIEAFLRLHEPLRFRFFGGDFEYSYATVPPWAITLLAHVILSRSAWPIERAIPFAPWMEEYDITAAEDSAVHALLDRNAGLIQEASGKASPWDMLQKLRGAVDPDIAQDDFEYVLIEGAALIGSEP